MMTTTRHPDARGATQDTTLILGIANDDGRTALEDWRRARTDAQARSLAHQLARQRARSGWPA